MIVKVSRIALGFIFRLIKAYAIAILIYYIQSRVVTKRQMPLFVALFSIISRSFALLRDFRRAGMSGKWLNCSFQMHSTVVPFSKRRN